MDLVHTNRSDVPSEMGFSHGSNYETLKILKTYHSATFHFTGLRKISIFI